MRINVQDDELFREIYDAGAASFDPKRFDIDLIVRIIERCNLLGGPGIQEKLASMDASAVEQFRDEFFICKDKQAFLNSSLSDHLA